MLAKLGESRVDQNDYMVFFLAVTHSSIQMPEYQPIVPIYSTLDLVDLALHDPKLLLFDVFLFIKPLKFPLPFVLLDLLQLGLLILFSNQSGSFLKNHHSSFEFLPCPKSKVF